MCVKMVELDHDKVPGVNIMLTSIVTSALPLPPCTRLPCEIEKSIGDPSLTTKKL